LTIDNLIPESWPEDIVTALDQWRQGHLIEGELGAWLSAAGRYDPVTGDDFPDHESPLVAAAAGVGDAGYLVIVSQTCDIAATGPGARHPFVQVCPVRDVGAAFSQSKVQQIRSGQIIEYVYLTKPPVAGKDWAVDLRMSIPLSKGALVAAQPIEGFATLDDELALAASVATKFERPALHEYLSKDLIHAFEVFLSKARGTQDWCDDVEQLRLQVEGNRLAPKRVRLIVVTDIDFNGILITKKKPLRDLWKSHRKALRALGIEQDPIAFRTLANMSVTDYRNSIPLNLPALGRGTFA
jgi:hypothetical protein